MDDQKQIGTLESESMSEQVPEIERLAEMCAGPVEGSRSGAFKIHRIFYELPPELLQELDATINEAAEDKRELAQALAESADKWGRDVLGKIKAEVTSKARTLVSMESTDIREARTRHAANKKEMKLAVKKAMKAMQEKLNKDLGVLDSDLKDALMTLRKKYKAMYERTDKEILDRSNEVTEKVSKFIESLQELSAEQLQEMLTTEKIPGDEIG